MEIAGYSPNSYVDYPKNIASVIFLPKCPLRCCYCHNRPMLDGEYEAIAYDDVISRIEKNKVFLDGVVITGGEPTLTPVKDLKKLINDIKSFGLLVKLDTCGSDAKALEQLVDLVDYIAMDVKAPLEKYHKITPVSEKLLDNIARSIDIVKMAKDYEFRTTLDPKITHKDIEEIAKMLEGSKAYYIQQFVATQLYAPKAYSSDYLKWCVEIASEYLPTYSRGV